MRADEYTVIVYMNERNAFAVQNYRNRLVESFHREGYNIYMVHEHSNNINNNNDIRYYGNVY